MDKKTYIKKLLCRLGILLCGGAVYAMSIALFLDPHGIAPGGITGISVIVNHFFDINTGLFIILMNIPLLIAGLIKFGKDFLVSTIWSTVTSSLIISGIESLMPDIIPVLTENKMLAAIAGGAIMGLGLGIVFRNGGTTGGSDIAVKMLRQKFRHLKSGAISLVLDSIVCVISAIVYRDVDQGLYAGIAIAISSFMFNRVLYGGDNARLVYIISNTPDKIADRLLDDLSVGVTYIHGEGAWTGQEKQVIMAATKNRIFPRVKQIVREEDPKAFMIVSSASEIYGEGFKINSNIEM